MGDEFPNMIGVDPSGLDEKARPLLPDYMTMGQDGMGDMAEHIEAGHMPVPRNSIPMVGGAGPFDYITMGGLFTIFKVHPDLTSYDDPGWYEHPVGTVAASASAEAMRADGVKSDGSSAPRAPAAALRPHRLAPPPPGQYRGILPKPGRGSGSHGGHGSRSSRGTSPVAGTSRAGGTFTCPMHPEVVSKQPGACPKCGMTLVPRRS
jgi:hypothetical protein